MTDIGTARRTCSKLGVKRARELCASGAVKAFRIAGRWLIDRDDFVRWVREHDDRKAAAPEDGKSLIEERLRAKGVRLP